MRRWTFRNNANNNNNKSTATTSSSSDNADSRSKKQQQSQSAKTSNPSNSQTKWSTLKLNAPTAQTKADLQEIINKHQAAALLEANDTIRALEEQREEHRMLLQEQQMTIETLKDTMKFLQSQVQAQEKEENSKSNGDEQKEIQKLRRKLREQDELIRRLKSGKEPVEGSSSLSSSSNIASATTTALHESSSNSNDSPQVQQLQTEISNLQEQVQTLTTKNQEQQDEIFKLENILNEIETFQQQSTSPTNKIPQGEDNHQGAMPSILEESSSQEELSPINESLSNQSHDEDEISASSVDSQDNSRRLAVMNGNATPPKQQKTMTLNGNQLLLLFSSMPMNSIVAANQSRLETILQSLDLSLEADDGHIQVLDGCDPDAASINLRNDLFRISGLPAKYPQLFLVNFAQNDIRFVGDFETLQEYHDNNTLAGAIGLTPIENKKSTD